jgi:ABC-type taurine transport system ATPase subunit
LKICVGSGNLVVLAGRSSEGKTAIIDGIAAGNVEVFLNLYDLYVKQTVINHPLLLRKAGWIY